MNQNSKHISFDKPVIANSNILNEDSFYSDRYQIIFELIALFFGVTGLQYLYVKRKGIFITHLCILAAVIILCPYPFLVYVLAAIHIISAIIPYFVYTDGEGYNLRTICMHR